MSLSRISTLALILVSNIGFAQNGAVELKFDTEYFGAVEKWAAFPKDDADSTFIYGFIYLDNQAGFTFDFKARFQIGPQGLKNVPRDVTAGSIKYRLEPNTSLVAVLNKEQIAALGLPEQPEWLSIYKRGFR
mgnify:CR=1 FL=1